MISNIQMLTNKTNKELSDLSKFIVKQNLCHHAEEECIKDYQHIINSIIEQEIKTSKQSSIFIVENEKKKIEASIRVLKWNYKDILPIQEMFGISPFDVIGNTMLKHVWHIGRFAIDKSIKDLSLFKKLMVCALTPVFNQQNSVVFAECDQKLVRVMKALGIQVIQVGEGIDFLGSIKVPICIYHEGIVNFYNKNKELVPAKVANTFTNVSIERKNVNEIHNYPLV